MNYPIYKKEGMCYTCILSPTRFIQVDISAGITSISAGDSVNVVSDAMAGADMPNGNIFQSAYRNAKENINAVMHESVDYLMQKFPKV